MTDFVVFVIHTWQRIFRMGYGNRHHLIIRLADGQLTVRLLKHEDYVETIEDALKKMFKKVDPEAFIQLALEETKDCNFIIFQGENEDEFVQFWRGDGKITFDYPMFSTNNLGKYKYQVLGLLAEGGFSKMRSQGRLLDYFFVIDQLEEGEDIQASFARDAETAAKFCIDVFTRFFNQDLKSLRFMVG